MDSRLQARCKFNHRLNPRPRLWGKSLWGSLAHKRPNGTMCLSPQLATCQPYPFSQSKSHRQAHVVRQGGSLDSQPGEEKQVFVKQ